MQSASELTQNHWNHIAVTFSDSGNVAKLYINGVLDATNSSFSVTPNQNATGDKSVSIGAHYNNDSSVGDHFDGYITDVRIYNTNLDASNTDDIEVLASKMNGDTNLLAAGTTNLRARWKLTNGSPNDEAAADKDGSAAQHNLTEVGSPADVYDAFSVNVQDNTTTTDGAVTVTQGKLEGLSLSSVTFDGANDYIAVGNCPAGSFTISAWVYDTHADTAADVFSAVYSANGEEIWLGVEEDDGDGPYVRMHVGGGSDHVNTAAGTFTKNKWVHLVGTWDGSTAAIYINGVSQTLTTSGTPNNPSAADAVIASYYTAPTTSNQWTGNLRDIRLYDYGLSADQAASLYSGSYNVTPLNWWKLDEAAAANAAGDFEDSGTGTDQDGEGVSIASFSNGTLDLDGTLTIAANGTLSAPRGDIDLAGNFTQTSGGTYTHNNGRFHASAGSQTVGSGGGAIGPFYNITTSTGEVEIRKNMTVENNLTIASGFIRPTVANATWTMGTATSAASITGTPATPIKVYDNPTGSAAFTVQGVNSLYPCVITGNNWDWAYAGQANTTQFANVDCQISTVTIGDGSGNGTIKLTGDCEFDAVTIAASNTLDLNGQRMETSGSVYVVGTGKIDFGTNGLLFCGDNFENTSNNWVLDFGTNSWLVMK